MDIIFDRLAVDRFAMLYSNVQRELNDEIEEPAPDDRFKIGARKKIWIKHVLRVPAVHATYQQIYDDIHKYEQDVPGLIELTELIRNFGWRKFLVALEYYVARRGSQKVVTTKTVTPKGVGDAIKKVKGLPKWVGNSK